MASAQSEGPPRDPESELHGEILVRNTFLVTILGAVGFVFAVTYTVL